MDKEGTDTEVERNLNRARSTSDIESRHVEHETHVTLSPRPIGGAQVLLPQGEHTG